MRENVRVDLERAHKRDIEPEIAMGRKGTFGIRTYDLSREFLLEADCKSTLLLQNRISKPKGPFWVDVFVMFQ